MDGGSEYVYILAGLLVAAALWVLIPNVRWALQDRRQRRTVEITHNHNPRTVVFDSDWRWPEGRAVRGHIEQATPYEPLVGAARDRLPETWGEYLNRLQDELDERAERGDTA